MGERGGRAGKNDMQLKLKYVLPLAQMLLAIALYWWSDTWFRAALRVSDMPGLSPAFTLLVAINAPAALPRALWYLHVSEVLDRVILIVGVGLLWYWVALNIDSWRKGRRVCVFEWSPLRLAVDLVFVGEGVFLGFLCLRGSMSVESIRVVALGLRLYPFGWLSILFIVAVEVFLVAWSFSLVYFFGRDFIHSILRTERTVGTSSATHSDI